MRPALTPLLDQAATRLVPGSLTSRVFAVYGVTLVIFFTGICITRSTLPSGA